MIFLITAARKKRERAQSDRERETVKDGNIENREGGG